MSHKRKNHHVVITGNVKAKIAPIDVVYPSLYTKLYTEQAHLHHIALSPEELLDSEILDEKVVQHVLTLVSCTEKAIDAIEKEDKTALTTALAEAKALRDEINELRKIVYEDTLTQCYNRKWFEDTYLEHNRTALRNDGTLVLVDLNRFKEINDTFGHVVGDKVLSHLAQKLKEIQGQVIRYGGDEFLIIFDAVLSTETVVHKFETMLQNCDKKVFKIGDQSFKVSFAYGIAPFHAGNPIHNVIEAADTNMYRHKRECRG